MASTYSTDLRIELMADGEASTTWGSKTNTNWNLIEQAVAGVVSVAMTDAEYTLSTNNAASDEARNAVITMTGTLTASRNVIVPSVDKKYTFKNSTTGGFAIVVKTSAGTGITIENGATAQVYCDATNVVSAAYTAAVTLIGAQTHSALLTANLGLTVAGAAFNSRGITDNATAKALTLSGSGANSVTIANSATSPVIAGSVAGATGGAIILRGAATGDTLTLTNPANTVNGLLIQGGGTGSAVYVYPSGAGSDADVNLVFGSKGIGSIFLTTGGGTLNQVVITNTASANRYITLTGANTANPKIATSAGSLDIGSPVVFTAQTVGTTVGAAGGASALPATPLGYLTTSINGTACKIPYYTA